MATDKNRETAKDKYREMHGTGTQPAVMRTRRTTAKTEEPAEEPKSEPQDEQPGS